jgi:hypothetical protein
MGGGSFFHRKGGGPPLDFDPVRPMVMLFITNKRSSSYQMPKGLKIYGQEIPFSKTAKYLGGYPR